MTPNEATTLKATLREALEPIVRRVEQLEQRTNAHAEVVREDATGKRFTFGGGEHKAPAHLRGGVNTASKPLMLSNILRGLQAGGGVAVDPVMQQHAGGELDVSRRLVAAGYRPESNGGILWPLGSSLLLDTYEGGEKTADIAGLRKEIQERERLPIDPGEVGWLVKRFPDYARQALGLSAKDLALGDDSLGGQLVPSNMAATVIDLLRPRVAVIRAGATEIPLPAGGNLSYPRVSSDPSFTWTDPDSTTDASTSNLGTGVVRLQAKSLRGYVTIPNDLLRYAMAAEVVVRRALAERAAVAEDNAFLESVGSSLAPKGILNYPFSAAETPTAGKVTLHVASTTGANGDTFQAADLAKMIGLYYGGNDGDEPTGWIMRPMLWVAIANRRADAVAGGDQAGPFLWWDTRGPMERAIPQRLGGSPVFITTNASANRVKGSGTNLVYAIFGNFRRAIIGRVGVIELAVSEHVKFLQDKTVIRAVERVDMGLEHEEALVCCDQLLEA